MNEKIRSIRAQAEAWLSEDPDPKTRQELATLLAEGAAEGSDQALLDRFDGVLEFGTAGIRGVLGAGPLRMNRVLVRRVSRGVADYYARTVENACSGGVVIGYDGRINSRVFAEDTARVFLGAGFRVYLSKDVLPTPVTAYGVLHYGAACGVMVTASHNPPEYNGYKVYADNGAQIIPPHDAGIAACIEAIQDSSALPLPELDASEALEQFEWIGDGLIESYLEGVRRLRLHPELDASQLRVAYTPLHGVGARECEAALKGAGFPVETVASQREPDGAFPTVRFPNPEEEGAMDAVIALAKERGCSIVIANDPDADRLAVALPFEDSFRMLSGDQVGILLADYLLKEGPREGVRAVSASLVSSQLLSRMAELDGAVFLETLTGFKWIANAALRHKEEQGSRFVMGYEEALGYTIGELVRDKDGISAALLFCEMSALYQSRGVSVFEALTEIYRRFGLHFTKQHSLVLPGAEGKAQIDAMMAKARETPPAQIGGFQVESSVDLLNGHEGLPPGNVLVYRLEGGRRVILRPSGTEPKLKSYYEVVEALQAGETFFDAESRAKIAIDALCAAHQESLR